MDQDEAERHANLIEVADALRAVIIQPDPDGASLGEIFRAYEFKQMLRERGLAVVPRRLDTQMTSTLTSGWFVPVAERYERLLKAVWRDQD